MARPPRDSLTALNRRQRLFRERELAQDPRYGEAEDDDPSDHGIKDRESRFADEDGPVSLDKLFR